MKNTRTNKTRKTTRTNNSTNYTQQITISKGVYKRGDTYFVRPFRNGKKEYYTFTNKRDAMTFYKNYKASKTTSR